MRKCGCRSRVCQVIRRHIDCLYRCNRTVLCGCNSLLQCAHLRLQCRLISYSGWHTAKQCGYLRTCLCETENIVDEKKHVFSTFVTEIFCHRKSGQRYTHTGSRWLIHLSEYHGRLVNYAGFFHFVVKVISLTGTLSYSGKYGISAMLRRNIVNQLLNQYGLSYTRTSKQSDFSTLLIWAKQIYDFDTGLKHLL